MIVARGIAYVINLTWVAAPGTVPGSWHHMIFDEISFRETGYETIFLFRENEGWV